MFIKVEAGALEENIFEDSIHHSHILTRLDQLCSNFDSRPNIPAWQSWRLQKPLPSHHEAPPLVYLHLL